MESGIRYCILVGNNTRVMMIKIAHLKICTALILFYLIGDTKQTTSNAGSYGLFEVKKFVLKNCDKTMKPQAECETEIGTYKNSKGHNIIWCNMKILKDVGPLMAKIRIFRWSEDKYVKTLTMNQANVCQYAFPLKALPFTFHVDDKCMAKAATYPNNSVDLDSLSSMLLGKKFFYGNFKVVFEWFTKKYSVICVESESELGPP